MMGYLDRLRKLDSGNFAPCVLPKLPKPLLTVKTLAMGDVFGKRATVAFDQEWFDERAGTLQYEAGFSREEAERRAYLEVTK